MSTGGPAFPGTLLDWFAGQALEGLLSNQYRKGDVEQYTADAYTWATAMLAEKSRREAVVKESSTTDHSGEAGKMVELEARNRELVERIKRLENAGNEVVYWFSPMAKHQLTSLHLAALNQWNAAKEAKP